MICGIGVDLVEIGRIEAALARTPRLAQRILTPLEYEDFLRSSEPARFLAKRFAAKEAAVKALGTGFRAGIGWQQLQVQHGELRQPQLCLTGAALARAHTLGVSHWHLSYSDEKNHVVAMAVAERRPSGYTV